MFVRVSTTQTCTKTCSVKQNMDINSCQCFQAFAWVIGARRSSTFQTIGDFSNSLSGKVNHVRRSRNYELSWIRFKSVYCLCSKWKSVAVRYAEALERNVDACVVHCCWWMGADVRRPDLLTAPLLLKIVILCTFYLTLTQNVNWAHLCCFR
jgi:hypothetical protein